MTAGAFRGRRVLVTGGAGFLGSSMAHHLSAEGAQVTVIDAMVKDTGANPFNLEGLKADIHRKDLRDRKAIGPLVKGQDFVFHFAGQVSHSDSMRDPFQDLGANAEASLALLEACRRGCPEARILFSATRQQYGRPRYLPLDEAHPQEAVDINGIHKRAAEDYHLLYHRVYGMRCTSLRLTNTYGPRQLLAHPRQGFVPWFVRLAMEGKPLQLFGGGEQRRDFSYVDDVLEAFLRTALNDATLGEAYNVGGERPYSLNEFVRVLFEVVGGGTSTVVPFPPEKKSIDIGDAYCTADKLARAVGWAPKVPLKEGLERTVAFYRKHLERYT